MTPCVIVHHPIPAFLLELLERNGYSVIVTGPLRTTFVWSDCTCDAVNFDARGAMDGPHVRHARRCDYPQATKG